MNQPRFGGLALVLALSSVACSSSSSPIAPAPRPLAPSEAALRAQLGVPPGATTVVVFAQNAHLDIDWQRTFDDYYASFVGDLLIEARQILEQQPRAFYSVAEMAFLQHHLAAHPEELAPLRAAAARGALRIVGGGITSPDTLLPETEMLLRDLLYGVAFAEDTLGAHPHSAWLPDSFGHAATVPDLLSAAGYDSVGFARVDGASTQYEQIFDHDPPPKPGSTAEQLLELGTADFTWRGPGGGSVLAHFMAAPNFYCAGDNLDYQETLEVPGGHTGPFAGDDTTYTDGQIDGYVAAMTPYKKTPYVFVPVGCDFQHPKPQLIQYLDGYNQRRYPTTGVWAVAAPFEDYETLVSSWSDVLPELSGDLTPYYMGFYGTRADVKRGAREAARPFFEAETFATALGAEGQTLVLASAPELSLLVRTNHHDFITGTANDQVVATEQMPLLAETLAAGQAALGKVATAIAGRIPVSAGAAARVLALNAAGTTRSDVAEVAVPIAAGTMPSFHAVSAGQPVPLEVVNGGGPKGTTATVRLALSSMPPFAWRSIDLLPGAVAAAPQVTLSLQDAQGAPATGAAVARVVLSNADVRAQWDRKGGFVLTSLVIDGAEAIAEDSFVVHDYKDTGGLWRTGNEMAGCVLSPLPAPTAGDTVEVLEASSLMARVVFQSLADGSQREVSLGAGATGLDLAVTTGAAETTTRTLSFALAVPAGSQLSTSLAGGSAVRALERVYTPTFWPAVEWAQVGGWAISLRQSTGVRMSVAGQVELMAARDAREEQCDYEGGTGSDPGIHRIEWHLDRASSALDAERAAQAFNRPLALASVPVAAGPALDLPAEMSLASIEGGGVVSAIKPAERGGGVIVRALLLPGPAEVHLSAALAGHSQTVVDAVERDLRPLSASGDTISFDPASMGAIASVRLQ